MSSFPFLPRTISLVDKHSGIYQGTGRCRCSHSTGAITADTVQIERSGCSGTSADSEHLYSITHSAGDRHRRDRRKGRNCITVVADQAERNMVRVVPGKDAHTVERFVQDFIDRNGDPNRVGLVTCNISLEFARGICEHLPNAAKVIDKFHTSSSTPTRPSTGVAGPRAGTTRNTCVCATNKPTRTPIGDQAQPAEASAQDR
ncbi:MAG: transposase [Bifidobacterium pseudocatenulatum]